MVELIKNLFVLFLVIVAIVFVLRVAGALTRDIFGNGIPLPEPETPATRLPGGWIEVWLRRLAHSIRVRRERNRQRAP